MASGWVLPTVVGIIMLALVVFVIIIMVYLNRLTARINVMPNMPIIDVTMRKQFTEGYSLGLVKSQLPRKNGTILFEFYPLDAEQGDDERGNPLPRPSIQSVVVAKQYVKRLARGDGAARREVIKVLSRDPTDIPVTMRETDEGEWLKKEGQKGWLEKTFGTMIPQGDEAIHEVMRSYARGNLSRAALAQIKEENAQLRKLLTNPEPEQTPEKTLPKK